MGAAVALAGAARLGSAAAAPACTITWDGGAVPASTAWATAANWSGDTLPGAADHVCIPAGATVVHSTGTTSILSLQSQGALTLSGGTLSLTDTTVGNESNAVSIVQSGGTLDGAATLIVSSSYQWSFGTQTGAGETRIGVGATLTRTGASTVALTQRTLRNGGTVAVTGTGAIQAGNRGADRERGRGDVRPAGRQQHVPRRRAGARFENAGTLRKSGGAATSTIAVELDNDGAVEASSGTRRALRRRRSGDADRQLRRVGRDRSRRLHVGLVGSRLRLELHGSGRAVVRDTHCGGRSDGADGGRDDDDPGRRHADRAGHAARERHAGVDVRDTERDRRDADRGRQAHSCGAERRPCSSRSGRSGTRAS